MNRSPPVQAAIARSVLSAVQVDPETRTTSALPADQVAVAASAALAVFDAAGLTPDAAAQADFERDVWDRDSFPNPARLKFSRSLMSGARRRPPLVTRSRCAGHGYISPG